MIYLNSAQSLFTISPQTTLKAAEAVNRLYQFAVQHFQLSQNLFFLSYGTKELALDTRIKPLSPSLMSNFSAWHGTLFLGSGILGVAGLTAAAASCFILANLAALEYNLGLVLLAMKCKDEQKTALLHSGLPGALSSLSYIFAAALAQFDAYTTIALVIGAIGACFGSYKILYDFFCLQETTIQE